MDEIGSGFHRHSLGGWQPDEAIMAWARNMILMLRDGASWGIPATGQNYTFDKTNKKLILTVGNDDPDSIDIHEKNKIVFGRLGWTVVDAREKTC